MQYVDASALLKVQLDEADRDAAREILDSDPAWASGRHTLVEVRRNLARLLEGDALDRARRRFANDWQELDAVDLGERASELGAEFAERTGVRSLDSLHLGAAELVGGGTLPFVTFDRRLAEAARSLGWTVLGA